MMNKRGQRWTTHDCDGNLIYLTEERWSHIIDGNNHPEMLAYEQYLKNTIAKGRKRQEPLNPRKYRYFHTFTDLPDNVNHIVFIVIFGYEINNEGHTISNNYVATAFFKHIQIKRKSDK